MAKQRIIQTKFWSDPFVQEMKTDEKLVYLYLLTNERTSICGVYEITKKTICFDTDIKLNRLVQIVDKLVQLGKISIEGNWIMIKNFAKNQKMNPSVLEGIERAKKELPQGLFDRLGTACIQSGLLELEPKLEPKLELSSCRKNKIFDDEVKKLSDFLFELIKQNNPNFKGNPRKWDEDFDKLIRIDKRDYNESAKLLQLVQEDDFWRANILSGKKFREKYDQLFLKLIKEKKGGVAFIS